MAKLRIPNGYVLNHIYIYPQMHQFLNYKREPDVKREMGLEPIVLEAFQHDNDNFPSNERVELDGGPLGFQSNDLISELTWHVLVRRS